jgi:hypothetical protein
MPFRLAEHPGKSHPPCHPGTGTGSNKSAPSKPTIHWPGNGSDVGWVPGKLWQQLPDGRLDGGTDRLEWEIVWIGAKRVLDLFGNEFEAGQGVKDKDDDRDDEPVEKDGVTDRKGHHEQEDELLEEDAVRKWDWRITDAFASATDLGEIAEFRVEQEESFSGQSAPGEPQVDQGSDLIGQMFARNKGMGEEEWSGNGMRHTAEMILESGGIGGEEGGEIGAEAGIQDQGIEFQGKAS